jgi:hypothetical protein
MSDRLDVVCPCCDTRLVVDVQSGEILAQERPRADVDRSFEAAMDQVRGGSRRREEAFAKAFDRTRRLDDLLSKKFEEAKKKAAKDEGEKPFNPMDLD